MYDLIVETWIKIGNGEYGKFYTILDSLPYKQCQDMVEKMYVLLSYNHELNLTYIYSCSFMS